MLDSFELKEKWLPKIIKSSSDDFGRISETEVPCLAGVKIGGVIGDQ